MVSHPRGGRMPGEAWNAKPIVEVAEDPTADEREGHDEPTAGAGCRPGHHRQDARERRHGDACEQHPHPLPHTKQGSLVEVGLEGEESGNKLDPTPHAGHAQGSEDRRLRG